MKLKGKTALVTGSGRNIGKAIALAFAREGANVVINARSNMKEAQLVADEAKSKYGVSALPLMADVGKGEEVNKMIGQALATFGAIDILVNNPKYNPTIPFKDMKYEDWRQAHAVILDGAFFCIKGVLPKMLERRWGRIINIGAGGAYSGGPNQAHYFSAKMGLRGLTRGLARELAPQGILVNDVAPGVIDTIREGPPLNIEAMKKDIPVGHIGRPEDIAEVCAFLAADTGNFINGEIIHVNGGRGMF